MILKDEDYLNENISDLDNIWPHTSMISNYGDLSIFRLISVDVLLLITTSY